MLKNGDFLKIAIVGSRECTQADVNTILPYIPENCTEIISGGAMGIDSIAEAAACALHVPFVCIRPDYKFFGKRAPLVRNCEIARRAELVLAFWNYRSHGTHHIIQYCVKNDIPIKVIAID